MSDSWTLKGAYFETCNCETACPCVFLSPPTEGECTVLLAWHVDEGRFGDVSLNGLNVALAAHSPGTWQRSSGRLRFISTNAHPESSDKP